MRRWHIAAALTAAPAGWIGRPPCFWENARNEREKLSSTGAAVVFISLQTGMTRKQVEDYFSARSISFHVMCCVSVKEFSRGVYDNAYYDLVKIGQEDVPFVCSENNVYIAFQFLGSGKDSSPRADASDRARQLDS
jgi:hypothetical protein